MKILLLADLHYDLKKFDWVAHLASHFDVVVIAGDHLDLSSIVDRPAQAVVVQKYFRRIQQQTELLVCSGNHDLDSRDANGELVAKWLTRAKAVGIPADGDSVLHDDTLFSPCAWWDGDNARARIGEQLASDAARAPSRWIWIYHAPPSESPTSWGGRRSYGDQALHDWIERYQPYAVFCGHVHQSPFVSGGSWADRIGDTWVFNAGHQIGPMPAHIIVDTDGVAAYWLSLAGGETVQLDQPLQRPIHALEEVPDWLRDVGRSAALQLA